MRTILVTGGLGFIGSNFIPYFMSKHTDVRVVNLDKCTYAADRNNLSDMEGNPNYVFVQGDICDEELLDRLFKEYEFQGVIHFAAESHVDNSIQFPDIFVKTNIEGTFRLLKSAYNLWMEAPFKVRSGYATARFHHISTDEVYGSLGNEGFFTEQSPYAPNSPYSASKASSDMIVRSYFHTYGLNVTLSHCSNNYGAKQHREKLIPVIVEKALKGEKIPIYGDGKHIRDWLYVEDHCRAVDLIFHQGKSGDTYNIGAANEWDNYSLAVYICRILDQKYPNCSDRSYTEQIAFVADRSGHDRRYAIDASKIQKELGWKVSQEFSVTLGKTVEYIAARVLSR